MNSTDLFKSPNNAYALRTETREVSHGKWIVTPTLLEHPSSKAIFTFTDTNWSLDRLVWEGPASLRLFMRKYPGGHQPLTLEILINCAKRTALFGAETFFVGELESKLESALTWPKI